MYFSSNKNLYVTIRIYILFEHFNFQRSSTYEESKEKNLEKLCITNEDKSSVS